MGHCDLALVRHLGVPAVLGYWSHQLVGGEALLTAASLPASHVPFVVGYTDEMSFFQRILNYAHRLAIRTEIWYAKLNLLIKQDPGREQFPCNHLPSVKLISIFSNLYSAGWD